MSVPTRSAVLPAPATACPTQATAADGAIPVRTMPTAPAATPPVSQNAAGLRFARTRVLNADPTVLGALADRVVALAGEDA